MVLVVTLVSQAESTRLISSHCRSLVGKGLPVTALLLHLGRAHGGVRYGGLVLGKAQI